MQCTGAEVTRSSDEGAVTALEQRGGIVHLYLLVNCGLQEELIGGSKVIEIQTV